MTRFHRPCGAVDAVLLCALVALISGCSNPVEGACGQRQTTPGPTMRPGDNCLSCHQDGFGDEEAPEFTAAGTIFASPQSEHCDGVEGVKVVLMAADGSELELVTNEAGNFWTDQELMQPTPGPRIEFEGRSIRMMRELPTLAACNACHSNPPVGGAPGKIFAP
ncbi:MAG: DUF3365 domain-containing protein [Myxococcales bacterium]|nr:DUF3365 domain-containing protein [Myxococcales bacterium]